AAELVLRLHELGGLVVFDLLVDLAVDELDHLAVGALVEQQIGEALDEAEAGVAPGLLEDPLALLVRYLEGGDAAHVGIEAGGGFAGEPTMLAVSGFDLRLELGVDRPVRRRHGEVRRPLEY